MSEYLSTTSWIAQTPERLAAVKVRSERMLRDTQEEHFGRLMLEWAKSDEGAIPSRAQAAASAVHELEVLCRALGRIAALEPHEVFPTRPLEPTPGEDEDWW